LNENKITAIQEVLRSEPTLLVLDNFETPLDGDSAGVQRLLEYFSDLQDCSSTILITTRTSSVPTELCPAEKFDGYELCSLNADASRELFLQRAPKHAWDKNLNRLLYLLDGYPLAICLTATRASKEDNLSSVITMWEKEAASYTDNAHTNNKEQSLGISLNLSINSPIVQSTPNGLAMTLLIVLAEFPHGFPIDTLRKCNLYLSAAEWALRDSSLVQVVVPSRDEWFESIESWIEDVPLLTDKNEHGHEQLRLLVPVAKFVQHNYQMSACYKEAYYLLGSVVIMIILLTGRQYIISMTITSLCSSYFDNYSFKPLLLNIWSCF